MVTERCGEGMNDDGELAVIEGTAETFSANSPRNLLTCNAAVSWIGGFPRLFPRSGLLAGCE